LKPFRESFVFPPNIENTEQNVENCNLTSVVCMRHLASHLRGKREDTAKSISVQNTGENIWTTEERGWKRRMQKIVSCGAS
jgi:hypothetical protein